MARAAGAGASECSVWRVREGDTEPSPSECRSRIWCREPSDSRTRQRPPASPTESTSPAEPLSAGRFTSPRSVTASPTAGSAVLSVSAWLSACERVASNSPERTAPRRPARTWTLGTPTCTTCSPSAVSTLIGAAPGRVARMAASSAVLSSSGSPADNATRRRTFADAAHISLRRSRILNPWTQGHTTIGRHVRCAVAL